MALNTAGLDASSNGFKTAFPYLSLHSTGAVTSSANETTAPRQAANWTTPSSGNLSLTAAVNFVASPAVTGAVVRVGYWSASTSGTYGGGCLLTGDAAFNSVGEYTVTAIAENVSST